MNHKHVIECYLDQETPQIIKFIPEEIPKEIPITYKIFIRYFPSCCLNFNSLKISNIGLYSIAKPDVALAITKCLFNLTKSNESVITDALANVGGMTITFAKYFNKVNACEIVPLHCEMLTNNLKTYMLDKKVNVICDDYMNVMKSITQDIIFFDPPWGGKKYKNKSTIPLGINNVNIVCIVNDLLNYSKYIAIRVPFNFQFKRFICSLIPNTKIKLIKINTSNQEKSQFLVIVTKDTNCVQLAYN